MLNQHIKRLKELLDDPKRDMKLLIEELRLMGNHLSYTQISKISGKTVHDFGIIFATLAVLMNNYEART